MRAADSKGPPPPPSPPLFSQQEASVLDNPQYAYMKRYQESLMRVDSSNMSDPSCGLHRAALGEECPAEDGEKERRGSEEPRMTQSPPELLGAINLHMELATKKREVAHLVDEMTRLQSSINNLKEMSTSKISQLQDAVTEKDRVIKDLAEKLLRQQDYSDLKRELRLLKALDMGGWQSWSAAEQPPSPPLHETKADSPDTNGARMTPPSEDEGGVMECVSTEQLQRCLRLNVERFSGEALNTLSISRCVRELLSVNNIGQRLFAKLVLGLSQGTVSELLSKPKPWDKLTEKGRDSYRKMHAWACDQHCVLMLKSLLPKKGREGSSKPDSEPLPSDPLPPPPTTTTGSSNEDTNNNSLPVATTTTTTATMDMRHPLYLPELMNGGSKPPPFPCHFGPEIPPVMLAHIYQEELLKLIGKRMKEGQPEEQAKQAQDEIRQALAIYHRELTLLAHHHHHPAADPSCCPLHHRAEFRRADQPPCCMPPQNEHGGSFFPPEALKVLPPYGGSPMLPLPPTSEGGGDEASPLQRMQSITNSLLSQAAAPSFSALPQRPMKAVLPPITQQQFDHYNNLNTEDIVKRVKEQLSQYSISQRLFGESVLGLSQGSVSDLLARPKPWHMLTQKGREPFIRMRMFLDDDNAVHKLVASQYKIAPERLMRMGGYGGVPLPPGSTRFSPVSSSEPPVSYPSHRHTPSKPSPPPSAPESPSAHSPAALPSSGGGHHLKRRGGGGGRCLAPYVQPSVYEMAAVTTDLDTQVITARIKETLTVHNIGQKLFGEAVLGLSQGSVSELLSKPKPWHMLSIKGREPFIRMQLWLNDPANVDKLQAIKTERREANKRRRNAMEQNDALLPPCDPPAPFDPLFLYPSSKKPRILFSEEQKEALRLAFQLDPYPSTAVVEFLCAELALSVRTITNWFHNHRMRLKQQQEPPPQHEAATPAFDPIRFRLLLGQRLADMCKQQVMPTYFGDQRSPQKPPQPDSTLDLSVGRKEDEDLDHESSLTRTPSPSAAASAIDLTGYTPRISPLQYASSFQNSKVEPSCDSPVDLKRAVAPPSSNRRKPAAPQWVDPGLDLSRDSDLCGYDDDEEDDDVDPEGGQVINGVCVRQTDFHPDLLEDKSRFKSGEDDRIKSSDDDKSRFFGDDKSRLEREENIRRLERAISEHEEQWDDISDDDDDFGART